MVVHTVREFNLRSFNFD